MLKRFTHWWYPEAAIDGSWSDTDLQAWAISFFVHLGLLFLVSYFTIVSLSEPDILMLVSPFQQDEQEIVELPEDFFFDTETPEEVGALSENGTLVAMSEAPEISDISELISPEIEQEFDIGEIEIRETFEFNAGEHFNATQTVRGAAGVGTTGTVGAVDRLTQEILRSLEERKTLVVWLFDQSGSLDRQRASIVKRFDRIYKELGVIEESNHSAARDNRRPLLTMVMSFGERINFVTKRPTASVKEIKAAVRGIQRDESGVERVFEAIHTAARKGRRFRVPDPETGEPHRNVMIIAFTDEAGDDQSEWLDRTVEMCRRQVMPVYVVGVPAPFGRRATYVKWIDPDPSFDQSPQWARVDQGPETLLPERIRLPFSGESPRYGQTAIDSGFGPFGLTRLCYETGGIYFAVHPQREKKRIRRHETQAYTAYISKFFDPDVMRNYRPDYVSTKDYMRQLKTSECRQALVKAAQASWISQLESPTLRFVHRNEGQFANELTEAQKAAAKVEPGIRFIYQTLQQGERDRERETSVRWQAGYDLAMGRVLAVKVRAESYNSMLAKAKRGLEFTNRRNNTWRLIPSDDISVGSRLKREAEKSREYLNRVIDDHPETPWAYLADRELRHDVGWKWVDGYTNLDPPRRQVVVNSPPNRPRNQQPIKLPRRPERRKPPRL